MPLDAFWISVKNVYPILSYKAIEVLLQFSTSYLCELEFSYLNIVKYKRRTRKKDLKIRNEKEQ